MGFSTQQCLQTKIGNAAFVLALLHGMLCLCLVLWVHNIFWLFCKFIAEISVVEMQDVSAAVEWIPEILYVCTF